MDSNHLVCDAIGVIASKPKIFTQKNGNKLIRFKFSVATSKERIVIKIFDLDEDRSTKIVRMFSYGDTIKVSGDVQCDAYISKDRLVKGICIMPTQLELLKKSESKENQEVQIIDHTS